ncbi:DUF1800 domain-containing protein [Rhabdochromatium marinum]|uniref:DUF1800 domain-containing protein n=1 Tax=Rhabdochromatium marinum TaxID=48729 RepID=UPI0019081154|nr:DUF1800 domain-containing protein [Rhabdochromatium marinum]MBK1648033.1 hypothetical protein [Rhabdochromatium marinum]
MKAIPVLLFLCLLIQRQDPLAAAGMGQDDARHLLARTGFGPTWSEIQHFASLSRSEAIEHLLADTRVQSSTAPPAWGAVYLTPLSKQNSTENERRQRHLIRREWQAELRRWWLSEMRVTPSPLTERMTLFWHGHFTSAFNKVRSPVLMYRQNALLRAHALGRFDVLLHEIAKDPAMLIYLDGALSRQAQPNENFAREVMELFTLSEGKYREADIKAAARAFTGWSVDRALGAFRVRFAWHDRGVKTLFGRTGRFDGNQVLDLLLARPETAQHITRKLWREFISPQPDATEIQRIADRFRQNHYAIQPLLSDLLHSAAFWAPDNRGTLIKSPVEFLIGLQRQLAITPIKPARVAQLSAQLGQNLFSPPTVAGWPGGESWLDTRTLLLRNRIVREWSRAQRPNPEAIQLARQGGGGMSEVERPLDFDIRAWIKQFDGQIDSQGDWHSSARRLLLPLSPLRQPSTSLSPLQFVQGLLLDPVHQLK